MKDKLIQIRADEEFISKLRYLRHINGFISIAKTIRYLVEKEYEKEKASEVDEKFLQEVLDVQFEMCRSTVDCAECPLKALMGKEYCHPWTRTHLEDVKRISEDWIATHQTVR